MASTLGASSSFVRAETTMRDGTIIEGRRFTAGSLGHGTTLRVVGPVLGGIAMFGSLLPSVPMGLAVGAAVGAAVGLVRDYEIRHRR